MEDIINNLIMWLKDSYNSFPFLLSLSFGFGLIVLESIIPILPLALFIALNLMLFGNVLGFILSWIATICGCILSYSIFKYGFIKFIYKVEENHPKTKALTSSIRNISFSNLVIIMAIPFTPAFSINIGAGLSKMRFKKFFFALLISKLFIFYFWGFIGTTLLESITDITVLTKIGILLLIAFLLSKVILKKFNLE